MSKNRTNPNSGRAKKADMVRGPSGRPLCRRCGIEVPKGRRTFCGDVCVHEWKIRSSPEYLRLFTFKRDLGVCAECKLDTYKIEVELIRLRQTSYSAYTARRAEVTAAGFDSHRHTFWDAEHKVAVAEGGGECGLEGIITLCLPCHKKSTAALRVRMVEARKAAKKLNEEIQPSSGDAGDVENQTSPESSDQ